MRYQWIQRHGDALPVAAMCRVLAVSDSGYYSWRRRKPSPRAKRTQAIRKQIRQVFEQSQGIYGSRKQDCLGIREAGSTRVRLPQHRR